MALPDLFTDQDLAARLSARVVQQIFDDNQDGQPDTNPLAVLRADASSYVYGYLRPLYTLPLSPAVPNLVKALALDVAVGMAAERHPEYVRRDGRDVLDRATANLQRIRRGEMRLDVMGLPEPAANVGGEVRSGDPLNPTPKVKYFSDGSGDF